MENQNLNLKEIMDNKYWPKNRKRPDSEKEVCNKIQKRRIEYKYYYLIEAILDLLKNEFKGKVLDCGAGNGYLSYCLKKKGFDVKACDILPENFEVENIFCDKINLDEEFPYKNNEFDIVCCVEVIRYLENPHHLLRELKRIIKKKGILIITTPNLINFSSRKNFMRKGEFSHFGRENVEHSISLLSHYQLKNILERNGFEIENLTTNVYVPMSVKEKLFFVFLKIISMFKSEGNIIDYGDSLIIKARAKSLGKDYAPRYKEFMLK